MEKKNWREDMQCHVLLCMPDGSGLGLWVPKNEKFEDFINRFIEHWYKVTSENPKLHGHIDLEEKCPKCGEVLHAKEYDDETRCWCPSCHYEEVRKKDGK